MFEKPVVWQSSTSVFKQAAKVVYSRPWLVLGMILAEIALSSLAVFAAGNTIALTASLIASLLFQVFAGLVFVEVTANTQQQPAGTLLAQALRRLPAAVAISIILALAISVGTALLVVPGVILYVFTSLSLIVLVNERVTVGESIRRSIRYVRGWWWRVCSRLIFVAAIGAVLTLMSAVPSLGYGVAFIVTVFVAPIVVAFMTLTYLELVEKKRMIASAPVSLAYKIWLIVAGALVLFVLVSGALLEQMVQEVSLAPRPAHNALPSQLLLHDDGTVTEELLPLEQ